MPVNKESAYERQRLISFLRFFQKLTVSLGAFFIVFFAATFFLVNTIFTQTLKSGLSDETLIIPERADMQTAATKFNTDVDMLSKIISKNPNWEAVFSSFDPLIGLGVTLTRFETGPGRAVGFTGTASTRESLIALRNYLDTSSVFTPIVVPLPLLLAKENIGFSFDIQFKNQNIWFTN